MPRVKGGSVTRQRRNRVLKQAKGFRGGRSKLFRTAVERVHGAWANAYRGRKLRKRDFRSLWIVRINAAARELGLSYNRFIEGLKRLDIEVDRKILAHLAATSPATFKGLVEKVLHAKS
ncbi:MAG: 50S ribosomal protein L20 [Deltaproteobacteria bacterium RIFOXYA12_FULL_61_11]|nr:MAG: 50S ribosomal protein L20 [Deltaproteobacteria bacterium RIFOXYA12_FULL_61_11]